MLGAVEGAAHWRMVEVGVELEGLDSLMRAVEVVLRVELAMSRVEEAAR